MVKRVQARQVSTETHKEIKASKSGGPKISARIKDYMKGNGSNLLGAGRLPKITSKAPSSIRKRIESTIKGALKGVSTKA